MPTQEVCRRHSSLAGRLTITQLVAAFKKFDLFIGNDSGPTHMAAALGLPRADPGAVRGGAPQENAAIAREVLGGAGGPRRDVVLLNAAAALRAAGRAEDWKEGMGLAAEAIDQGRAAQVLERWARASQAAAPVTA